MGLRQRHRRLPAYVDGTDQPGGRVRNGVAQGEPARRDLWLPGRRESAAVMY